jgi:hypothetical protein
MLFSAMFYGMPAHAGGESGAYLGFGFGQSSVEVSEAGQSFEFDETGYKFILGCIEYRFGRQEINSNTRIIKAP